MSPTITLNDGTSIPWIAFGTGTALNGKDVSNLTCLAIQNGFTHLDGAQMYRNEETLGAGIVASGKPRSDLYIVTKLAQLNPGVTVKTQLQESLQKLKVDYVDLFLVHSPALHVGKLKEVWKGMEEVKREGLAKSIGVSNFKLEHLEEILDGATIVPAVNQIEYHPYVFKASQPLVKFLKEKGIVIESYGGLTPLARTPGGPLEPVLETIRQRLEKTYGKPVNKGAVLTKWLQQQDIVVVTTTAKVERMQEYLETPNLPDLTADEIRAIEESGSTYHKRHYLRHIFGDE